MNEVIESLNKVNIIYKFTHSIQWYYDQYYDVWAYFQFIVLSSEPEMKIYFRRIKKRDWKPPDKRYNIRVRQDYFNMNIHGWRHYWKCFNDKSKFDYDPYMRHDPYVLTMYYEETKERTEKRLIILAGSKDMDSVLSKLTEHGIHHASLLRKKICRMSGISNPSRIKI